MSSLPSFITLNVLKGKVVISVDAIQYYLGNKETLTLHIRLRDCEMKLDYQNLEALESDLIAMNSWLEPAK